MLKTHYLKELSISQTCRTGSRGGDVKKIQEWLNLWRYARPDWALTKVDMDGDFGPQTAFAVKEFQAKSKLSPSGMVDRKTFARLCGPMAGAFGEAGPDLTPAPSPQGKGIKRSIVKYAQRHLAAQARELGSNNGPWVRAYMDGFELCRRIKNDPLTMGIKVIMVTAKTSGKDIETGISAGADHYITKPFKISELSDKIKELIG